jgi:hypothetical protein
MYAAMLAIGNTEFVSAIDRSFPRFRTSRLDEVVTSLARAQGNRSQRNLCDLLEALDAWRQHEPKEFANRGGTNGVAYRLWMETKQMLLNKFATVLPLHDPAMPASCPGSFLLNVYVPPGEGPGNRDEVCHRFAYRWAIAAGKMQESPALSAGVNTRFESRDSEQVLYPLGSANYPPARANGTMTVQPGDIIGMFEVRTGDLAHSLVAIAPTVWFSANNLGTFGVPLGRTQIDMTANFDGQAGWVDNGNVWRNPTGGMVRVIYRR